MWKHHTARSVYARKRVPLCKYERKYELLCGTCQHHTARGLNEYRKYELLTCVSVIQREYPPHVPRDEVIACVSVIQRKGCMRANEYREYELIGCIRII